MGKENKVAQSAAIIAIFTLASKGLGFFREVLIASKFGSGMVTDTYFVAMTATVIIMGTLGSALNTTLIPIFSEIRESSGRQGQRRYLNNILNLVFLITSLLVIMAYILSPAIIRVLAKGFEGEQFKLAVRLNRIGLPIIIFLGFTHVFSGYLQSNEIFGPHAIMGIPYNLVFLIYLIFSKGENIESLMLVSVIASLTQVLIQLPAVIHSRYRYSPRINLRDPYLYKTMSLVLPVLLGSAVHQINAIVDKTLASELVEGSISALTYANRVNDLIISVFVMAITTVVFPMFSRAFSQQNHKQLKEIFNRGVNIILLVTIPATVGILLLAEPMIRLFFQRNAFSPTATSMTSKALIFYSLGLVAASLRLLLNRVFYSLQDTRTPMINGGIAVIVNIILNLLLIRPMAHNGLALATSISAMVTTFLLFIDLRRKIGPIGMKHIIVTFIKSTIAASLMGIVVYLTYYKLGAYLPNIKVIDFSILLLSIILGALLYFLTCAKLKVEELAILFKNFR